MKSHTAGVSGIFIKRKKEDLREECPGGRFLENFGLEGDINSGEGPRQVCLLRKEDREAFEQDTRDGLCFKRFRETLQIEGLSPGALEKGSILQIGEARLRVTIKGKKCWPDCRIIQAGEICSLAGTVRFLEVIRTGKILKGDAVILLES